VTTYTQQQQTPYQQQQQITQPSSTTATTTSNIHHFTSLLATTDVTIDYSASPVEYTWPLGLYTPQFAFIGSRGDMPGFAYTYTPEGPLPVKRSNR